ncbi:MAG: HU family DNA-binding protein [Porticoccaceae bacterium]|nr:HU family DNA-binding protein [Porticoccaceae bacterium]
MAAKKTTKKAPAKKVAAKKAPAKKKAPVKKKVAKKVAAPARKVTAIQKKFTKTQTLSEIADNTGLTKKQVSSVLDELSTVIERHIKTRGAGEFTLPGMMKIKTVKKPARKARKGVNPFTGEATVFKARPASTAVKILALKALKDMAN